jgi:hypothetical protein
VETSSNSVNDDDDDDALDVDDQEWGLHKGMELFEVSSKDDYGSYFVTSFSLDPDNTSRRNW